jgi:2-(1,2-epoxy-1,2-dihydrophenyl)acetyl-CoA isomerase
MTGLGYRVEAGVAELMLDRPERLNALTEELLVELRHRIDEAAADPAARAVLLTGAGRAFCAGQDLTDRVMGEGDAPPDLGDTLERLYVPVILGLRALPKPVVCAVNGIAAGAGANLALACDLVLAARSAAFLQAFCRLGLIPDAGGTWFLPRLVGDARARGLALLGERLSAADAAAWGLIWRVVEDDALMPEARALARRLAQGPTRGFALIKPALAASAANDLATQLSVERDLQREAGETADYREGVRAFLEKREARFAGR